MATHDHRAGSWAGMLATLLLAAPCVPALVHLPRDTRVVVATAPSNAQDGALPTTPAADIGETIRATPPTPPTPPKPSIALAASFNRFRLRLHTLDAQPSDQRVHAIESKLDALKGTLTSERGDLHTITRQLATSARELHRTRAAIDQLTGGPSARAIACDATAIRTSLHAMHDAVDVSAMRAGRCRNASGLHRPRHPLRLTSRVSCRVLPRAPPPP